MKLSTHRVIQLSNILDIAQAEMPANFRRAAKAASINNKGARAYFLGRAAKFHQISVRAERLLQAA
jgi:hypothetical protein